MLITVVYTFMSHQFDFHIKRFSYIVFLTVCWMIVFQMFVSLYKYDWIKSNCSFIVPNMSIKTLFYCSVIINLHARNCSKLLLCILSWLLRKKSTWSKSEPMYQRDVRLVSYIHFVVVRLWYSLLFMGK